jgi:hypothetical protein
VGGKHAFVSYAHADFAYVRRLVTWLSQRGADVWFDEDIPTGERWESVLRERVESAGVLVVVMSPSAAASEWVEQEVRLAQALRIPVLPLLLAGGVILGLDGVQYEPVLDGRLPSDAFVGRLLHGGGSADRVPRARVQHQIGAVPGEAQCFQHRDLLTEVDAALSGGGTAIVSQVLTGLGGVGKTQLAAALARQFIDSASLDVLVWVTAQTRDAVVSAYARAARELLGADKTDTEAAAQAFVEWLSATTGQWLIVFDDLADPDHLTGLWPPRSVSGRVVVTTRRRDDALTSHGRMLAVGVFTPEQAHSYLTEKFGTEIERLVEADQLAADVGYLPLMLGQAAAFIADQHITCADYRRRLSQAKTLVDVVPEPGAGPDDYRLPVAAALLLSVGVADELRPAGLARPLLAMLSLLDPNAIPAEVVTAAATATYLTQHRANAAGSADPVIAEQARDALMCLARLNLVDLAADENNAAQYIRVHGLVQRATRDQTEAKLIDAAALAAADALVEAWPNVERDAALAVQLRSNAAALQTHAEDRLWAPDAHVLLFRLGESFGQAGLVTAAINHFEQLRDAAESRLGPDHPYTLNTRNSIARWRGEAGDPAGAADALQALLADYLRVLGPDHPATLNIRNSLTYAQGLAGDPAGAAAAVEALLADYVQVLGANHPDTLAIRDNLARWRGEAGDPAGAADALQALLADRVWVLGPDHPGTLTTRGNLALWRGLAGDPAGAVAEYEIVLADYLRVLGPDHPDTLGIRHSLASLRGEAGDPTSAAHALQALLTDQLRVLGPDHPDTLATRDSLAYWRGEAGDPAAAAAEYEIVLADNLRILGPDHPDTLATRDNLARRRFEAGDPAGAADALQALLTDYLRVVGPDHPATRTTRDNLAYAQGETRRRWWWPLRRRPRRPVYRQHPMFRNPGRAEY